jgi:hypothetical protein
MLLSYTGLLFHFAGRVIYRHRFFGFSGFPTGAVLNFCERLASPVVKRLGRPPARD